jgi:uncharacterized protein (TIGR00369 family)
MSTQPNSNRVRIHAFRDSDQREPLPMVVTPFAAGLNMRITAIDTQAGRLSAVFDVGADYVGGARPTVHGGAVATMLDISLASLVVAMTGADQGTATANLNVSYLRPMPTGRCTCEAEVERMGRTMGFVRAVLVDASGHKAATATATFAVFQVD